MQATDKLVNTIIEAVDERQNKKAKSYDTTATVTRIEGSTAYVHIPGGVDETPAELTAPAQKGDSVRVRVGGGRAWLIGNSSNAESITNSYTFINKLDGNNITADSVTAASAYIGQLEADDIKAKDITADHAAIRTIDANYARIDAANITELTTEKAWVDKILVHTGLLSENAQIYTLDAIQVNAANITAGTLDVERLIVTVSGQKYLIHIDPDTQQPTYEKLDGNVIEDLTITADKIVAGAITVDKITANNLQGTNGWINLHDGKFFYGDGAGIASSTQGIAWDGTDLKIKGELNVTGGNVYTKTEVDNIEVGGFNILHGTSRFDMQNSTWANYGWYQSGTGTTTGNVSITNPPVEGVKYGATLLASTANTQVGIAQAALPIRAGKVTESVWVKGTAGDKVILQPVWSDHASYPESGSTEYTIADAKWHKYTYTKTVAYDHNAVGTGDGGCNGGYVCFRSATAGHSCTLCALKMEYGDKATSWNGDHANDFLNFNSTDGLTVGENGSTNKVNITSSGMTVYKGGTNVASFGDTATIGKTSGTNNNVELTSTGLMLKKGSSNYNGHLTFTSATSTQTTLNVGAGPGSSGFANIKCEFYPLNKTGEVVVEGSYEKSATLVVHGGHAAADTYINANADKFELSLSTTAASGTDHDLYAAITALGWGSAVID